jgi:hypothetical protein
LARRESAIPISCAKADIVPVASLIRAPSVLEVNPSVPAKTVPEFIA